MAISKKIVITSNLGTDVVFDEAYITVDNISGGKNNMVATVGIRDKKGGTLLLSQSYDVKVDVYGGNFIEQAYLHIKSLSYFESCVDC